ncbi:MAG: ABC transporter permease [Oscillospiraceae bacterium]|nr:ABC transporter permease [Oscillospiraceae bacterium]
MNLGAILQAINLGLLWSIMAIGVFITFRILNFADLTVEGSFVLGAAVVARLITLNLDPALAAWIPLIATLAAVLIGVLAGLITGFLHTVLKIPPLLSGILTMTGLFSINLRIMGMANINLGRGITTLMDQAAGGLSNVTTGITGLFGGSAVDVVSRDASIAVGLVFVIIVIMALKLFFNTEIGYVIRATGDNEAMVKAQGVSTNRTKMLGLALGNGCVALSGALVAQTQGFADVNMGMGTIVTGLAAVIIGEVIFRDKNSHRVFIAVVFGAILFFIIRAFVLSIPWMNANDFRGITAIVIAIALAIPMFREKFNFRLKKAAFGSKEVE